VLVAIFSERESYAAYFLQQQDMTRYDAVSYISHGIAKGPGASETRSPRGADDEQTGQWCRAARGGGKKKQQSALTQFTASTSTRRPRQARSIR
jgi:ATP-dependent Clp protease ATP-binding subunit ClpA